MILTITSEMTDNEKRSLRRALDKEVRIGKQIVSFCKPGTGNYEIFVDNSEMYDDEVSPTADRNAAHSAVRRLMTRIGRTFDYEISREA